VNDEQRNNFDIHIPLVHRIARKFQNDYRHKDLTLEYQDVVQSGMIGLLQAAKTYRNNRGATFSTYAYTKIRWAILDAFRQNGKLTRQAHEAGEVLHEVDAEGAIGHGLKDECAGPLELAIRSDIVERVFGEGGGLNRRQRTILRLYYMRGLTFEEIARKVHLTESGAWRSHASAILILRKRLNGEK